MSDERTAIQDLRRARGDEQVTFGDVCDHLVDYVEQRPAEGQAIARLAGFLTRVEAESHDHTDSPAGSDAATRA